MKLSLVINNEKQAFPLPDFIPARLIRKASEFNDALTNPSPDDLDKMVDYVVSVYGSKFTRDDFYDGLDAREFLTTIQGVITSLVQGTSAALGGNNNPNK
ncbi:phage tail assembly chaperone G [Bacillus pseudomycoides]|uniref:phage tail assembly chaperone G n=1 Tax=Bacillus pseudomycoides TaxID=64104 RepID=UPI002FFF6933